MCHHRCPTQIKNTALTIALDNKSEAVATMLIEGGVDLDVANKVESLVLPKPRHCVWLPHTCMPRPGSVPVHLAAMQLF